MLWNQKVREIKVLIWQSNCLAPLAGIAIFHSFCEPFPRKTFQNGLKQLLHSSFYSVCVAVHLVR